jgi:hypothetical protein
MIGWYIVGLLNDITLYISKASFYFPYSAKIFAIPSVAKLFDSSCSSTAIYLSIDFFNSNSYFSGSCLTKVEF